MSDVDDDRDCFITREDTEKAISALEKRLAEKYHLEGDVRTQLVNLYKQDQIEEDELLWDWLAQYSSLLDWIANP